MVCSLCRAISQALLPMTATAAMLLRHHSHVFLWVVQFHRTVEVTTPLEDNCSNVGGVIRP